MDLRVRLRRAMTAEEVLQNELKSNFDVIRLLAMIVLIERFVTNFL